jgi:hypothetical protein
LFLSALWLLDDLELDLSGDLLAIEVVAVTTSGITATSQHR